MRRAVHALCNLTLAGWIIFCLVRFAGTEGGSGIQESGLRIVWGAVAFGMLALVLHRAFVVAQRKWQQDECEVARWALVLLVATQLYLPF